MDQFITIVKQKVPDIPGREGTCKTINKYITDKATICVYGDSGIGKTHLLEHILKGERVIEVTNETLKSKEAALEFIHRVGNSVSHVLMDDPEMDTTGWREIVNTLTVNKKLSRGSTIIICKSVHKIDFCDCVKMEKLSDEHLFDIGQKFYPNASREKLEESIKLSNGNIRDYFSYIEGSDEKDIFITPKEFVHDILTKSDTYAEDYIGYTIDDHGYSWGIVHENYISARGIDDTYQDIAEEMSIADCYDSILYNGNWDLTPYFCMHGIIKPSMMVNKQLIREALRPGSSWTKFNNFKMRQSKFIEICNRTSDKKITMETLMLIKDKCIKDIDNVMPLLIEYGLRPQDMDVINHLAVVTKIKPRALQLLKKKLRAHYDDEI